MYSVVLLAALGSGTTTPALSGLAGAWASVGCTAGVGFLGFATPAFQPGCLPVVRFCPPVDHCDRKKEFDPYKLRSREGLLPVAAATGTLCVDVLADAKLFCNGELLQTVSNPRIFDTPELNPTREHKYTLKAEIVRDGTKYTATKEVLVAVGRVTEVSFRYELLAAVEKRGKLLVTVPEGVKVQVNGRVGNSRRKEQLFDTPVLADGEVHHFTVSARQERDGQSYAEIREVTLKAGEVVRLFLPIPEQLTGTASDSAAAVNRK